MSKITIVEGNSNDKDKVRVIMVKGEKGEQGDLSQEDIIDNLTSTATDKVLSANQGRVLKNLVDNNEQNINTLNTNITTKANTDDVASTYATKSEVNTSLSNLNSQVSSLSSGSPLVASSTAEMTDTTRVYVNTSDGNWYYYNGTNWAIGGVYQATEDSITVDNLSENFIKSINLYNPNKVELGAVSNANGVWQRYTLENPTVGNLYACFNKSLNKNSASQQFIQYNGTTLLSQYGGNNYASHPILESCTKLVLLNKNSSSSIPLDLMLLDMTNKTLDDVTEFIDHYDTLNSNTKLLAIDPSELKGSIPYNLYNPDKVSTFDGTYQRSYFYNVSNKKYGFYCYNNGELKRLTTANNNGKYIVAFAYNSNHSVIQTYSNPAGDITLPEATVVLEVAIVNNTTSAYTNVLMVDKDIYSDDDITQIGFLPYSYFLSSPYYIREMFNNQNSNTKPYQGKKILSLGDSFTYMNYYGSKLAEITGCTQTPRGYNGANIGSFVANRYTPTGGGGTVVDSPFDAELLAPYDIVTVMGGTNNYGRSMPLGTINDNPAMNTSVYSEIKYVIDKILTIKPSIKIIWCTEPYRILATSSAPAGYEENDAGYTMEDVADAIINVCNHYGIPVFDFYRNSNWNSYTVKYDENDELIENIYTYDGLHPKSGTGNGGELLGISFGNFINTI